MSITLQRRQRQLGTALMGVLMLAFLPSCSGKKTIGPVEEVLLLPWGIHLPARVDTGAATSSLDVRDVVVTNNFADFRFPEKVGGQRAHLPLVDWRTIKSSDGIEEKRAVVNVEIRLAGRSFVTQVTLDDRAKMSYPMLVGRRTLKGRFAVDVSKTKAGFVESVEGILE